MIYKMTLIALAVFGMSAVEAVASFQSINEDAMKQELVEDNILHASVLAQN